MNKEEALEEEREWLDHRLAEELCVKKSEEAKLGVIIRKEVELEKKRLLIETHNAIHQLISSHPEYSDEFKRINSVAALRPPEKTFRRRSIDKRKFRGQIPSFSIDISDSMFLNDMYWKSSKKHSKFDKGSMVFETKTGQAWRVKSCREREDGFTLLKFFDDSTVWFKGDEQ